MILSEKNTPLFFLVILGSFLTINLALPDDLTTEGSNQDLVLQENKGLSSESIEAPEFSEPDRCVLNSAITIRHFTKTNSCDDAPQLSASFYWDCPEETKVIIKGYLNNISWKSIQAEAAKAIEGFRAAIEESKGILDYLVELEKQLSDEKSEDLVKVKCKIAQQSYRYQVLRRTLKDLLRCFSLTTQIRVLTFYNKFIDPISDELIKLGQTNTTLLELAIKNAQKKAKIG